MPFGPVMAAGAVVGAKEAVVAQRWIACLDGFIDLMQVMLAGRNEPKPGCP